MESIQNALLLRNDQYKLEFRLLFRCTFIWVKIKRHCTTQAHTVCKTSSNQPFVFCIESSLSLVQNCIQAGNASGNREYPREINEPLPRYHHSPQSRHNTFLQRHSSSGLRLGEVKQLGLVQELMKHTLTSHCCCNRAQRLSSHDASFKSKQCHSGPVKKSHLLCHK